LKRPELSQPIESFGFLQLASNLSANDSLIGHSLTVDDDIELQSRVSSAMKPHNASESNADQLSICSMVSIGPHIYQMTSLGLIKVCDQYYL
jgi:hypothetical protein